MPPGGGGGGGGSTPGNIADDDGDVPRRRRRRLVIKRSNEKKNPANLVFERQIAAVEARQQEQQQRQNQMTAAFIGSLSLTLYCPFVHTLPADHVKDSTQMKWSDVVDTRGTSTRPLLFEDSTQQGKGRRLLKESAKPPDDTDFLEGTFIMINSYKQKARNKKNSKNNKKKKKGKCKCKKQSHASEMQSEQPTDPSATCTDATGGETLASSPSRVAIRIPLLEYSSSSSSSPQMTEELIITPAVNGASSSNDKELLSASSSNDDFRSFESSSSYATATSSSVNDYYTGGNAWNTSAMGDYAGSLSDARSERSLSASDSTDSRGFKKTSGEGNRPNVHQSFSLASGPGRSQEALICTDSAGNDGNFQQVVSRKSAQKTKKIQRLESFAPTSTMAASSGPITTHALVPRSPFRELTIGDFLNDDTFYATKRNQKKGKYQKARSLNNLSRTGYTTVYGGNTMVLITRVRQAKPRNGHHHVTLEAIEETNSPSCLPKEAGEHTQGTNKEEETKTGALIGGVTEDIDSRAPTTSEKTPSLGHLVSSSSCSDDNREEQQKEENIMASSSHASSDELDKIIKTANNAYEIQAASSDVYMISGIHADIENFLHAATPVIGQISCTKSNILLQDQRLWSVWSWYEEPECCGIEVQMQGKINSVWPEFSTYFQPLLSAVQLFGQSGKSQNHGGLIFEYFELENPYSRPPIFTKIKQLRDGVNLSGNPIFGDPKQLESVKFSDLHPASWFCVAWYPICQVPAAAGSCQASFLTYHSLGKLVPQSSTDGHDHIICPIVGLLGYKDQGEKWFQLREHTQAIRFKPTRNVSSETDHAELLNKRLRTLRQGASIMSKAVVPRASGEAMNYHSDYEFFQSRSL